MAENKTALLDADFISKLHSIHNKKGKSLIEQVLEFPGFSFTCHEQTLREIERYSGTAKEWLSDMINRSQITLYSDAVLLRSLMKVYGKLSYAQYLGILENSCNTYSSGFFLKYYGELSYMAGNPDTNPDIFLKKLMLCDIQVGTNNNLGEIKLFTMAQVMYLLGNKNLFVFCSDDRKARNGMVNANYDIRVECVGALAVFFLLKELLFMEKAAAKEYFDSWMAFYKEHKQDKFRVYNNTRAQQLMSVEGYALFDAIYDNQYGLVKDGFLRLKDNKKNALSN